MVQPRPAATIVLARPVANAGFEVLLTRRPEEMRFLGGFYVFPGGTVHRDDYSPQVLARCHGFTPGEAQRLLGGDIAPDQALGHWVAVIRELFEEVGILICRRDSGAHVGAHGPQQTLERARQAVARKEISFLEFLTAEQLYCDLSWPAYFDHWVTPDIYSMRFDTRFYIAPLPAGQTPLVQSEEVTDSLWIAPQQALARTNRHDFPILPPTTTVLQRLARLRTWEALQAEFAFPSAAAPRIVTALK
jgi:8-oxo-dGTP pyrophosphatase MutT (NUDIX family)